MLFTKRTTKIVGDWYQPCRYLGNLKNTVEAEIWNMTSSAGDWDGYFVQKHNNHYYLVMWNQENDGIGKPTFTLNTGDIVARFKEEPTREEIVEIVQTLYDI